MEERVRISSDALYQYLTEHGVKLVRIAEKMNISAGSLVSCFKHQLINNGVSRTFTPDSLERLNFALQMIAAELRLCLLTFGSPETYTNRLGKTYDPALIEPMKKIGEYMNLTALVERVLGWNKGRKENVLVISSSKIYGTISEDDVNRINAEILSIVGVLSSYEVVPEERQE